MSATARSSRRSASLRLALPLGAAGVSKGFGGLLALLALSALTTLAAAALMMPAGSSAASGTDRELLFAAFDWVAG